MVMKIKLENIKVGDLVEFAYQEIDGKNQLGLVTKVDPENRCLQAIWSEDFREDKIYHMFDYQPIVGHWKVIDFSKEEM